MVQNSESSHFVDFLEFPQCSTQYYVLYFLVFKLISI